MTTLGKKACFECKKKFGKYTLPTYVVECIRIRNSVTEIVIFHIGCLPKCRICKKYSTPDLNNRDVVSPVGFSSIQLLNRTKRRGNPFLVCLKYLLKGPKYKSHPLSSLMVTCGDTDLVNTTEPLCNFCFSEESHKSSVALQDLSRIRQEKEEEAARIKLEKEEEASRIKKQKAKEAKEAKELRIERENEALSFSAAGIHEDLIKMYLNDMIPEQILLLIPSVFNETNNREDLVFILQLLLDPHWVKADWADINHWKEQFRLLHLIVEINKKKSISLVAIISCVTSNTLAELAEWNREFVFDADSIKRMDNILTWIETDEGNIIFDGIFSEPQKITYGKTLELLECGFEGRPEALMEVIEGGMNWKVVAIKYGFYQV